MLSAFVALTTSCSDAGAGPTSPTPPPTPTFTPAPMSVVEYAQAVCDPVDFPDGATWKELIDRLNLSIKRVEVVAPPEPVRDYHLSALAAMKTTLKAIDALDPNLEAVHNPAELVTNEDFMTMVYLVDSAESGLDPNVIAVLNQHGCNVGDEP